MNEVTGREGVLRAAERAVMADRNADYAPPEENFRRIADLWNLYLEGRSEITPYDTAIMMVLVKVARVQASPHLLDHLVDIAGYAMCAGDVVPDAPGAVQPAEPAPAPELATDAREWGLVGRGVHAGASGEVYTAVVQYRFLFDQG